MSNSTLPDLEEAPRQTAYNEPAADSAPITDTTGATLAGFRNAEDLIIPDVEDVVEESTSHHRPHGSDPVTSQTMVLNMGPQHPSTHGVLRLVLEVDGETVISCADDPPLLSVAAITATATRQKLVRHCRVTSISILAQVQVIVAELPQID